MDVNRASPASLGVFLSGVRTSSLRMGVGLGGGSLTSSREYRFGDEKSGS